jgi:hypothetical protein
MIRGVDIHNPSSPAESERPMPDWIVVKEGWKGYFLGISKPGSALLMETIEPSVRLVV